MVFAHPFSSLVVTKIIQPLWNTKNMTKRQELLVWATAIISTVSPDFDLVYAVLTGENHRFLVTHTFLPYIILATILLTFTFVFSKQLINSKKDFLHPAFLRIIIFIAFLGVALHLFTDTLGSPVRLLYPFSNKEFIAFQINSFIHSPNLAGILQYYSTPLFFTIEFLWISTGLYFISKIVKTNIYIKKYLPGTLGFIVASAATMLAVVLISRA